MNRPDGTAHEGPIDIVDDDGPAACRLKTLFVRYPGCQQLQLWLPQPDLQGLRRVQVLRDDGLVAEDTTLRQRLSGPVKLLFDTLAWPPGAYRLVIDAEGPAPALELALVKRPDVPAPLPAAPAPPSAATTDAAPQQYRDGWGRLIPDEAQALRDAAFTQLLRHLSRRVSCHNQGRAGTVSYEERLPQPRRIVFDHEMAGGPWHWWVAAPAPDRWHASTGFALAERDEILRFVAESLQRDQCPGWAFTLRDDGIVFHDGTAPRPPP